MSSYPPPEEVLVIEDAEVLKVIADPLRLQIIKALKHPGTVKDIGASLDRPPTKLYYHINLLEKHGLIRVVDTQVVSGIIEKTYHVAAKSYQPDETLLSTTEDAASHVETVLNAIFDSTKAEMKQSIRAGLVDLKAEDKGCRNGQVWQSSFSLNEAQLERFCSKLQELLDECKTLGEEHKAGDPEAKSYSLTLAFYPQYIAQQKENDKNEQ